MKWIKSKEVDFYNNVANLNVDIGENASNIPYSIQQTTHISKMTSRKSKSENKITVSKPWFDTECQNAKAIVVTNYKQLKNDNYQVKYYETIRTNHFKLLDQKKIFYTRSAL